MISCHLMGGLGNQLFQIATVLAIAKEYNKQPIFPSCTDQSCSRKISYNDTFFHKIDISQRELNMPIFRENGFSYKPIIVGDNIKIIGYFQSEKYFKNHKQYILDILTLPDKMKIELNIKYENIINSENTVSIHVRRGDYLKLQNFHCIQTLDYYKKAISNFSTESMFIIFSDDIDWCKNLDLFKNLKCKQYIQDIDYNELYLMSQCKHNIIANSTFSWWGAYMNPNVNKKIICPEKWFGPSGPKDTEDIKPLDWIVIK